MGKLVRVLSIDGGGIRGIVPAIFLAALEERAGKPVHEMFDLIAGTSTGGILALGLTCPARGSEARYRAEDLVELYRQEGPRIFKRSPWRRVSSLGAVLDEKYGAEGIDGVLQEYFGDAKISEALTNVLVTSYALEQRSPFFFKSWRPRADDSRDYLMREAARATSAAPTFFEPVRLPTKDAARMDAFIDGGVFANNPAMCAWAEARREFCKGPEDEVLVVSLGTGELTRPIFYEEAKNWGLASWAVPIIDVVFDGVSDSVDYQLRQLIPSTGGQTLYHRFQVTLTEGSDDMDDATRTNLRVLQLLGAELVRKSVESIDELAQRLVDGRVHV